MTESLCEFTVSFGSEFEVILSGNEVDLIESKRRESPRTHNVFMQQHGFTSFGRVFTVIHCYSQTESHCMNSHGWAATTTLLPVCTGVWLLLSHSLHTLSL